MDGHSNRRLVGLTDKGRAAARAAHKLPTGLDGALAELLADPDAELAASDFGTHIDLQRPEASKHTNGLTSTKALTRPEPCTGSTSCRTALSRSSRRHSKGINLQRRDSGLRVHCRICDRDGWFSGCDICRRITGWLDRPAGAAPRALRCVGCDSGGPTRWYRFDPGSSGYTDSPTKVAQPVWVRRSTSGRTRLGSASVAIKIF